MIERHLTLARAMWGSDQSTSVALQGIWRLVKDIRVVETVRGDGIKRVLPSQVQTMQTLGCVSL